VVNISKDEASGFIGKREMWSTPAAECLASNFPHADFLGSNKETLADADRI
jgi:hypothetical protein